MTDYPDEPQPSQPAERAADPRNQLNDLTGREWTYALRSVLATRYPTNGPEGFAHALRRTHPSPKPPQLMAELIRFFTRAGGRVLAETKVFELALRKTCDRFHGFSMHNKIPLDKINLNGVR